VNDAPGVTVLARKETQLVQLVTDQAEPMKIADHAVVLVEGEL